MKSAGMTSFSVLIHHPTSYILITLVFLPPSLLSFSSCLYSIYWLRQSVSYLWLCSEHHFDQPVVWKGANNPAVNVSDRAVTIHLAVVVVHTVACVLGPRTACGGPPLPQVSEKLVSPLSLNKKHLRWQRNVVMQKMCLFG